MRKYLFPILLIIFAIAILFVTSSSNKTKTIVSISVRKILLSYPFNNRLDNNSQKHDAECQGFYSNQISNPKDLNVINVNNSLKKIEEITKFKWQSLLDNDSIINITHYYKDLNNSVVYIFELVESIQDQELILALGSDDGFILWVNGDSIISKHKPRGIQPYSDFAVVKLHKGLNRVLYKVDQGDGGWGLYRKWISKDMLNEYFSNNAPLLYSDLPESEIIPDSSTIFNLKIEEKWKYDCKNKVVIEWEDLKKQTLTQYNYTPGNIPNSIQLPGNKSGALLYNLSVYDQNSKKIYCETIPVFKENTVNSFLNTFEKDTVATTPEQIAIRSAIKDLFHLNKADSKWEYSTRMKSHALYDWLCKYHNYPPINGPHLSAYTSLNDGTNQIFRLFSPEKLDLQELPKIVFIMHGIYSEDSPFLRSYEGTSHSLVAKRSFLSSENNLVLIMPHGRGANNYMGEATEELELIVQQLSNDSLDKNNASIIVWSKGTIPVLELLKLRPLNLKNIALISPIFRSDNFNEIIKDIEVIQTSYPRLNWFIRHGLDDKVAPINFTRRIVKRLEELKIKVNYQEVPNSNHFNYISDPEREFYKWISSIGK